MITSPNKNTVCATGVRFEHNELYVTLSDGREIGIPLSRISWLDWLRNASSGQRANWSLEPGGFAIYWEDLDDGIEVSHILSLESLS